RGKLAPDSKTGDSIVAKFINNLMYDGKKSKAEKVFYGSLDRIKEKTGKDALQVFHDALDKVRPAVEVRSRRVGGANYQVPMEVSSSRRQSLGIRWLITSSRSRSEKSMIEKLSSEIIDAHNNRGNAVKKKEDVHRMAEANRAFAHYRW
ncbi:MAG: 30S ribosomal protein S7, partial [Candidatus Dadabacteria bacterium]|nr:30S ribosomal protein S7 [Candidatus Dadabacteria bacterium]